MARSSATWVKGQAGNPKGRPKVSLDMRAMAQQYGPRVVVRLAQLAGVVQGHPGADTHAAQVMACKELLDRGYGKPVQQLSADAAAGPMVLRVTWAPALPDEIEEPATPLIEHETAD